MDIMIETIKGWFVGFTWKNNIYRALIFRLMLVMVLMTVCRIGFYYFNLSFFPEIKPGILIHLLKGGLVFDLATVFYFNAIYVLVMVIPLDYRFNRTFKRRIKYLFFISNGIALGANVVDFIYYRFTLRRTTADVFAQFENETNMGGLWLKFVVDYWYAALFFILLMVTLIFFYNKFSYRGPQLMIRKTYYFAGALAVPLIAYLLIGGMRGGFRHSTRPITLSNAGEYVKDPKHISIVLNTPFAIIRTVGKTKVHKVNYFNEAELDKIYTPIHVPADSGKFVPLNVVVIILESFSREFFGFYNHDKYNGKYIGYTPFLDSLIGQSRTFQYSFANGRKSIDGLPSVVSSIPSLGVPYFLSPYSGNKINSLASLLKKKGYQSSFFHGAPNGSMGFKAFMNIAGVDEYYGMDEYNNSADFDGLWGIWDEKFLGFYADKLNTFREPFFSSFFSVSSHHPFKVPPEYEGKFKGGPLVIHKCIQYTDYSLRKFFEKASAMPWYRNTLFVITADHTSSEMEFDETKTAWGFYSVPIIFFRPDNSLKGVVPAIAEQIDILPTVLGHLHFDEPFVAFGRDAFSDDTEPFAFFYKDDNYQLCEKTFLLQFNGKVSVALYDFVKDPLLKNNLLAARKDVAEPMEKKIKAIVQQYNNRMIEDHLVVQ
jgi:phosphoglycerol transferase MdoB-like AlkP superfamily enzyme